MHLEIISKASMGMERGRWSELWFLRCAKNRVPQSSKTVLEGSKSLEMEAGPEGFA